ncbi:hypothetical protein EPI10_031624 [Gossypium australe]|uniref:Uncharacterized protein n=1 Tax=Gossypium australe TaxID=47621 RepID=A0A5B6X0Y2_9ROSI|nr:hypothetical protein EPI10_031624 [Gossypium australe]
MSDLSDLNVSIVVKDIRNLRSENVSETGRPSRNTRNVCGSQSLERLPEHMPSELVRKLHLRML